MHKNKHLQECYSLEVKNRNRLSLHNEELQWKLKQNSEKFSVALTELSKSYKDHAEYLNETKASLYGQENSLNEDSFMRATNSTQHDTYNGDNISPPTSPVIKGVVEKSDSVSWVLEINDEESAEALASRMVRRAGSFRSSFNERMTQSSPAKKRPLSQNALSQSASATSILRQYTDTSPVFQKHTLNSRMRSNSVNVKPSEPKNLIRSNSISSRKCAAAAAAGTANDHLNVWSHQPLSSSSPNIKRSRNVAALEADKDNPLSEESEIEGSPKMRNRSDSLSGDDEQYVEFRRHNSFKLTKRSLITCNTAALTSKRPEPLPTMPTHPKIKESAGEAMVSGTNSEDEASTGSSDESISIESTNSSHSDRNPPTGSLEHVLMHKIVASLGGTPLEVSWSEDGDHYPNESVV